MEVCCCAIRTRRNFNQHSFFQLCFFLFFFHLLNHLVKTIGEIIWAFFLGYVPITYSFLLLASNTKNIAIYFHINVFKQVAHMFMKKTGRENVSCKEELKLWTFIEHEQKIVISFSSFKQWQHW